MPQHHGKVKPGSVLEFWFDTYDGGTGASITMTGIAVGDIEIYKDGVATTRASTTGYTLLDTDGIDFDSITGAHGFSVDLASNATDEFYQGGHRYSVWVASITVDAQTVNFLAGTFNIGYEGSILDTAIASLTSQTVFVLDVGPAEATALVGCTALIHDQASAVQIAIGVVSVYAVTSKTVTLKTDPGVFTMAAEDNISFFMPSNLAADSVNDIWDEAMVETSGAPAITGSMRLFMEWWAALSRNKMLQTATTSTLRNDADDADLATSTVSDNGTTMTRGEWST